MKSYSDRRVLSEPKRGPPGLLPTRVQGKPPTEKAKWRHHPEYRALGEVFSTVTYLRDPEQSSAPLSAPAPVPFSFPWLMKVEELARIDSG